MSEPFRPLSDQIFHLDEWLSKDQIERLEELAEAADMDLGDFIRQILDEQIQRELGN